jgi:uncharacterized protein YegJ (DUF2314 family)
MRFRARSRGVFRVLLLVSLLAATTACRRRAEPAPSSADPAPSVSHAKVVRAPDAGALPRGEPVPAKSLRQRGALYAFAIYHLVDPKEPPKAALGALLAKSPFALRAEVPKEPPTTPGVVLLSPKIEDAPPPSAENLKYFARGLSDDEKKQLASARAVTVLRFLVPGDQAAAQLRAAMELTAALARRTGGLVWDAETREIFAPSAWARRLESWENDLPDVRDQITMHQYRDGELDRIVTLGMAKFALPDVTIEQVASHDADSMGTLVNLLCQVLIEQGRITREGELDLDLDALTHVGLRDSVRKSLNKGAKGKVTLVLEKAEPQDGDAENALISVVFPGRIDRLQERQNGLLTTLFGSKDDLVHVDHDEELLAASARMRKALLAQKARFAKGIPVGTQLIVKAPFRTLRGGNEWMWVEVTSWKGTTFCGILENEPYEVPKLKAGAKVEVEEGSIFDYMLRKNDGSIEGGETSKLLQARAADE